jgi:hypothetical protein
MVSSPLLQHCLWRDLAADKGLAAVLGRLER